MKILEILTARSKYVKQLIFNSNRYKLAKRIVQYLQSEDCTHSEPGRSEMKRYFQRNLAYPFGYQFTNDYLYRRIRVFRDDSKSLYYVLHNKKKLYFKTGLTKKQIRNIYNRLCIEQDVRSPHSYFAFPIQYQSTDVALDLGAAEGIWALDIIDKVKDIYLFECEEEWIEALQATFYPYKEKVHIINRFVTDFTDEKHTSLDDFFSANNIFPTIIKADIEGAEQSCLKGATTLLNQHLRHLLLCAYHRRDDYETLTNILKQHGFEIKSLDKYMIFSLEESVYNCKDISTIFRKGLIYAYK